MLPAIVSKLPEIFVPTVVMAVIAARAIKTTIKLYSTKPPPCSDLQNEDINSISNSFVYLSTCQFQLVKLQFNYAIYLPYHYNEVIINIELIALIIFKMD